MQVEELGNAGGSGAGVSGFTHNPGSNGTGGLLIIYSKKIVNSGTITSNGSIGGYGDGASGGSSGAGSINIFYQLDYSSAGTISSTSTKQSTGGAGGTGSIATTKITF